MHDDVPDIDFDALRDLWQEDPETFGNRSQCAEEADRMGLVSRSFKETGWVDRFWREVTRHLFKATSTTDAPQAAVYVRLVQGEFWKPEEMCTYEEIAGYVQHDLDAQVDALMDVRDRWDRHCRARFGCPLPTVEIRPSTQRARGLSYDDDGSF